ncbi:hypothetical protein V6N12_060182 [Hibiscus sabdariffa]|uniref:Uncharacterized protein n=1 Tax=Hibiscus sabdariffa TaxID=183260 RepID=A0ABR2D3P4_9ROSI
MQDAKQSLLSPQLVGEGSRYQENRSISSTTFTVEIVDILPINGVHDFFREYLIESKKLWFFVVPIIFTIMCQFSFGSITQIGTLTLVAVSVQNSVIVDFSFGIMVNL